MDNTSSVRNTIVALDAAIAQRVNEKFTYDLLRKHSDLIVRRSRRTWSVAGIPSFEKKLRFALAPYGVTQYNKSVVHATNRYTACLYRFNGLLVSWNLPHEDYSAHQTNVVSEFNNNRYQSVVEDLNYLEYIKKNIEPIMAAKWLLSKLVKPDGGKCTSEVMRTVNDILITSSTQG